MAAKPSDSSRHQASLEVITRALPFTTIPDEPLRAHFARWLLDSLATADRLGPFPSLEPETSSPMDDPEPAPSAPETGTRPLPITTPPEHAVDTAPDTRPPPPASLPEVAVDIAQEVDTRLPPLRTLPKAAVGLVPEAAPPDDPPRSEPLPLEWQGPPAPPRPQFVRQRDGSIWVTKPILRSRGWTDSAVRDFLPQPEGLKPNPRFAATGAPMPVWRPATVAAVEGTPEWQAWLERSLRRRQTTLEALAETEDDDFRARVEAARTAIESERGAPHEAAESG
ncbi:hypothetical protein GALLR39Z86_07280 [Glycomyces algeriensis]|uniref:Uncharacterized protein n=2 Tax=Glycomyces algeriensis TaxID=256037 RepID=A0A9W6G5X2_9ACTN|nr:hypothetical protein GALLR39Z86_07280 [Glycomyces algeriensis]